jgi:hypothetical protein
MLRFKTRILIFLLCATVPLLGQTRKPRNLVTFDYKPFHFGYSVGLSAAHFTILPPKDSNYLLEVKELPGFNISLIAHYKLGNNLGLRFLPGFQVNPREVSVTDEGGLLELISIESIFIDLPFLIKYRADRVNNYAPYLIAGVNPRADLNGASIGESFKRSQRLLKAIDIAPELGVGIDFYLEKVKVAAELKFSVGMLNIYKQQDPSKPSSSTNFYYKLYANGVGTILSRIMILSIHVE